MPRSSGRLSGDAPYTPSSVRRAPIQIVPQTPSPDPSVARRRPSSSNFYIPESPLGPEASSACTSRLVSTKVERSPKGSVHIQETPLRVLAHRTRWVSAYSQARLSGVMAREEEEAASRLDHARRFWPGKSPPSAPLSDTSGLGATPPDASFKDASPLGASPLALSAMASAAMAGGVFAVTNKENALSPNRRVFFTAHPLHGDLSATGVASTAAPKQSSAASAAVSAAAPAAAPAAATPTEQPLVPRPPPLQLAPSGCHASPSGLSTGAMLSTGATPSAADMLRPSDSHPSHASHVSPARQLSIDELAALGVYEADSPYIETAGACSTTPGGTAPGGTAPGGTAPGGTAPDGTAPGGRASGACVARPRHECDHATSAQSETVDAANAVGGVESMGSTNAELMAKADATLFAAAALTGIFETRATLGAPVGAPVGVSTAAPAPGSTAGKEAERGGRGGRALDTPGTPPRAAQGGSSPMGSLEYPMGFAERDLLCAPLRPYRPMTPPHAHGPPRARPWPPPLRRSCAPHAARRTLRAARCAPHAARRT